MSKSNQPKKINVSKQCFRRLEVIKFFTGRTHKAIVDAAVAREFERVKPSLPVAIKLE